jgi:DNA-binding NtrC family response regulator
MPPKNDLSWLSNAPTTLRPAPAAPTCAFRLTVVRGPDTGAVVSADAAAALPALIGTGELANLRLRDPEVSRRHVSLEVQGPQLRLRDLGSTNGTHVNGLRVTEAFLIGDETIELGSTVIHVVRDDYGGRPLPAPGAESFGDYIGRSLAMRRLYPVCERLAASDVPLVIEGETGTGKEALAEALHARSARAARPFVIFDCTAVPGSLIEAALFGHEKGAFTGATMSKAGVFEEADGGTLLIDEIGDLDKALQAKLLRAIQKAEVRRLGGNRWIKVDVRIIAATRRDLDAEVQADRFRDDLFFRLAVARIVLPPLRERREDIELLARHFWDMYGRGLPFPEEVLPRLTSHPWPGNVRELANTVARLVALGNLEESGHDLFMQRRDLGKTSEYQAVDGGGDQPPDFIDDVVSKNLELARARELVVREFERRYVSQLLETHEGDVRRAASASGIGERYLRMMRARFR